MARPSLLYKDYKNLAAEKGLTYIEPEGYAPNNSRTPVRWRCNLTGHEFTKAYQRVKSAEYGTRYQREFPENMRRYNALADVLGIKFMYKPKKGYFPRNTKTKTLWMGPNGVEVMASFRELGYNAIPERLIEDLGLSMEVLEWDVSAMLEEELEYA